MHTVHWAGRAEVDVDCVCQLVGCEGKCNNMILWLAQCLRLLFEGHA